MKIKFLGAAGTVTGSSYLLTSGTGESILIDLGMFQGLPEVEKLNYAKLQCDAGKLSGVVLTHAHLDHSGRLPLLLPLGYSGYFWMTPETSQLTQLSLLDSAKVMAEDNPQPLYDKDQVHHLAEKINCVNYHIPFQVGPFQITFRDAGHILGSAIVEIRDGESANSLRNIVFSGDLGNSPEDLLKATETISSSDIVVMESTYGDRLHSQTNASEFLKSHIRAVESSGGTVLIPVFSLERSQEILHLIMHLKKSSQIQSETRVYLDSPMADKATRIYLQFTRDFNPHIQGDISQGNPFEFPGLFIVPSHQESTAIHETAGPKVILAGSGMMTGGRIVGHAAHYLPLPETHLLIVGYQAERTLGRSLQEGAKTVIINDRDVSVKATVDTNHALSSHADQAGLIHWFSNIKQVKKLFLTHGENPSRRALSQKIKSSSVSPDIILPDLYSQYEI